MLIDKEENEFTVNYYHLLFSVDLKSLCIEMSEFLRPFYQRFPIWKEPHSESMNGTYDDFLCRLKEQRKQLGLSQEQMAQRVHKTQSNYSKSFPSK